MIHVHTNESSYKEHKLINKKSKVRMSGWWDEVNIKGNVIDKEVEKK